MPNLEHFEVVPTVLSAGGFSAAIDISMPHLRTLILLSSEPVLSGILMSLPFPQDRLSVACHPAPEDVMTLVQYLADYRNYEIGRGQSMLAAEISDGNPIGWKICL